MIPVLLALLLAASPGPPVGEAAREGAVAPVKESALVLVPEGAPPTAQAVIDAYAALVPKSAALEIVAAGERGDAASVWALRVPRVGRIDARAIAVPVPAEAISEGARRSLASLLSDAPIAPHAAQLVLELTPDAEVPPARALDAFTTVAAAAARASDAAAIMLPRARVTHPADFVINAVRERSALSIIWVGLELSGTTDDVVLTSVGLTRVGRSELQLGAPRRRIGQAIVMFHELVAEVLRRDADVPDDGTLGREAAEKLPVRLVPGADGRTVMRVDFDALSH